MKRILIPALLLMAAVAMPRPAASQAPGALPQRADIPAAEKWKLEDIYATNDGWEADFRRLEGMIPRVAAFKGHLGMSGDSLLAALRLQDSLGVVADRLMSYAGMRRDEDNRVALYQGMVDRFTALGARLGAAGAFSDPEMLAIPPETLAGFYQSTPALALYRHKLDDLQRRRAHTLPEEQEKLLAEAGEVAGAPSSIFLAFNNADLRYGTIKDETGKTIEITKGRFARCLESPDRRVRRDAFWAMNGTYGSYNNTLGATMNANVKKNIFFARARKYDGSLQAAVDGSNIPVSVYESLVKAVNANLGPLHRYAALRKKWMKLDTLKVYDLYTPLVPAAKIDVTFEQAKKEVLAGLAPLGKEYLTPFANGLESGWIDVRETQGKTSGAYSWGSYSSHPYVLLNWAGNLNDEFTLAHEMGHSMHSYFTRHTQPPVYGDYATFVAEVASTGNEALLINHLLKQKISKEQRLYLLNYYLEQIRTTFFRQTLFAEFEMRIHAMAEGGQPLTAEAMNKLYRELFQRYYGDDLSLDSLADYEWSRIPHFYRGFYVYQYATSYAAAQALSQQVLTGGQPAVKRYMGFLKAGSSKYPIEILKDAGVDMATPAPVEATVAKFSQLLDEMEKLWDSK